MIHGRGCIIVASHPESLAKYKFKTCPFFIKN